MSVDNRPDDASSFALGKLLIIVAHFFLILIISFVLADLVFYWAIDNSQSQFYGSVLIWLVLAICLVWLLGNITRFFFLFTAYGRYFDGEDRHQLEHSTVNAVMTVTALLLLIYAAITFFIGGSTVDRGDGKFEELARSYESLNSQNSSLRDELTDLDKRITQVSLALENMSLKGNTRGEEITVQRQTLSARMQELKALVADQARAQAQRFDGLLVSVAELTQSSEDFGLGLSAAMHDQSSIGEQVSKLIAGADSLRQNEQSIVAERAALSAEFDSLSTEFATAIESVDSVNNRIDSLEQSIEKLLVKLIKHESANHAKSSSKIEPEQQFLDLGGQIPLSGGVLDGLALAFDNARLSPAGDIVGGVTPKGSHMQSLKRLISLVGECASTDSPTQLRVVGFASSRPFRKGGEILAQSDALNLATANKRAESIYAALAPMVERQGGAIVLDLRIHGGLEEMASLAPYKEGSQRVSANIKESLARSVLIQLTDAGTC
ncbi:MAG: hypothetical protein GXP21_06395 [Gammaproteobacteria bacterium]|nr:hypothetical protein [Gammaproteobacteria bacterium]